MRQDESFVIRFSSVEDRDRKTILIGAFKSGCPAFLAI